MLSVTAVVDLQVGDDHNEQVADENCAVEDESFDEDVVNDTLTCHFTGQQAN